MELYNSGIIEALDLMDSGEVSPEELLDAVFQRINSVEDKVKAFVTVTKDRAYEMLDEAKGERGALRCIPLAIKDNICIRGIPTTCSSRILKNFIPPYESTVTKRLKEEGYLLVGKTNLDEFAMGSSTENSGFHTTRNPWATDRVPGGSSGGSTAAVAAGECLAALGSDTGGSIRQPAAFCGVVGLKPTYGRVSRFGLVAFASSLDQIGPITKNVADAALLLGIISGHDPSDSTSAPLHVKDYTALLSEGIRDIKVGIPKEYFIEGLDPEVESAVKDSIRHLGSLGCSVKEISLPHTGYAVATYYILATSEASSNLARYDGVKYGFRAESKDLLEMYRETRAQGFGAEVKRRIMLGTYALSAGYYEAFYRKAQQVRTLIKEDFDNAFREVDIIITPTTPTTAFRIGEKISDPLQMYLNDIFTISVNLAGLPAISIPCGFDSKGLPIGLQLIGRAFDEESILKVAHQYEQSTEWYKRRPPL
ncbi:MAG TPA: Asp-tRNA(Asn)/Glu-tRNA(Gln) amidotransferase subunit GatA [Nitrospirae bacterium]|nr:Asp-tRNA(Asn)/Glu-tRNA(Gln) amidotransferase subunit GatA [Nitrospirota bacterium]